MKSEQASANDGSLFPIREDIRLLRMKYDKIKLRVKELQQAVNLLELFMDGKQVIVTELDAQGKKSRSYLATFRKKPLSEEDGL